MKTLNTLLVITLFVSYSCNSGIKSNGHSVTFGIHETIKVVDIPKNIIDTLKSRNIKLENDLQQPILGYITKADTSILQLDFPRENFMLIKTYYKVDKDKKYYAILAVRRDAIINNSHIQKTKAEGNNVIIYFNMKGANKWADLTKQNIGKTLVFIMDKQIYSMPLINSEIRNGLAAINGIENQTIAEEISASLNSSLSK